MKLISTIEVNQRVLTIAVLARVWGYMILHLKADPETLLKVLNGGNPQSDPCKRVAQI
jgi:hypothetical protein